MGGGARRRHRGLVRLRQRQAQPVVKLKDVDNQELQDALRAAVAGDLQNSESLFDKLVLDNPDSASIWSNRGSVRVQLGKYEAATEDFTRAIQLAPDAPVPYLNRAIAYEALGQFDEAIADCKSAIINDPDVRHSELPLLTIDPNLSKARRRLPKMLFVHFHEFAAWFNLGNAQSKVKDYPNALKAYERASLLAPGIAGYRLRQALALFQLERPSEAAQLMKGLVRKYPNYAEAHAALAAVLWSSDKQPGAEDEYRQATEQEPNFESIQWVKSRLQWPPKAVSAMEAFLAIKRACLFIIVSKLGTGNNISTRSAATAEVEGYLYTGIVGTVKSINIVQRPS
eukprot:SM000022S07135  [mRNA]  locus=s22:120745:122939:+ [translate_table: standard]